MIVMSRVWLKYSHEFISNLFFGTYLFRMTTPPSGFGGGGCVVGGVVTDGGGGVVVGGCIRNGERKCAGMKGCVEWIVFSAFLDLCTEVLYSSSLKKLCSLYMYFGNWTGWIATALLRSLLEKREGDSTSCLASERNRS